MSSELEQKVKRVILDHQLSEKNIAGLSISQDAKIILALSIKDATEAKKLEPLRASLQEALGKLEGASSAQVIFTADKPQPRAIIAVASGKGGVGKSTVAANLALALMRMGYKTGLLDADIYGPSQPIIFGLPATPPPLSDDKQMIPPEVHGLKVMSIGFMLPPDQALVWRGPMIHSAMRQMLADVAWGALDVLVVDLPPGTGDAQISLAQQAHLQGAVIVSTPQDLALADARRAISMFGKLEIPVLGLVENMSQFCCPNCGHTTPIFGHGGAKAEATKLNLPFLGEIPLDMAIRAQGDAGTPVTIAQPDGVHAQSFMALAQKIATSVLGAA